MLGPRAEREPETRSPATLLRVYGTRRRFAVKWLSTLTHSLLFFARRPGLEASPGSELVTHTVPGTSYRRAANGVEGAERPGLLAECVGGVRATGVAAAASTALAGRIALIVLRPARAIARLPTAAASGRPLLTGVLFLQWRVETPSVSAVFSFVFFGTIWRLGRDMREILRL